MFSKDRLNQIPFRRSDWDDFMETCIGKPLLMHLTLNCVYFLGLVRNTKTGLILE